MIEKPRSLVTGAAGFIGSHLCERLLDEGHEVIGLDGFVDFYPRPQKEANLAELLPRSGFHFVEADLLQANLSSLLEGVDFVFHQAGQPGVRGSWGKRFDEYLMNNVLATQRLLEAAKGHRERIRRLVYASSSSVYGAVPTLPLTERDVPRPFSPYGVTKLAGEQLCLLYHLNYDLPIVALRYFTVYGPRQRPDMAFQRFIDAILSGDEVIVYGDGEQTRDFTYVSDGVEANLLALKPEATGCVLNIGGGARITINGALTVLERLLDVEIRRRHVLSQPGDVRHTFADVSLAGQLLGYRPRVALQEGLTRQVAWFRAAVNAPHGLRSAHGGSR